MSESLRSKRLLSEDVRDHNLGLVLSQFSNKKALSRSYLARTTGLTPGSLTAFVEELERMGFLETLENADSKISEPGRRKRLLSICDTSYACAGFQLTQCSVRCVCESMSGKLLIDEERPISFKGHSVDEFASYIASWIEELLQEIEAHHFLGLPVVGVVIPGPVVDDHRTMYEAIDFHWDESVDICARIEYFLSISQCAMSNVHVLLFNDANCSLWADYINLCDNAVQQGCRAVPQNVLYMKADIGIGGAAVIGGKIYGGSKGMAIEPGHILIDPGGSLCECGRRGCLVTVAGPDVLIQQAGLEEEDRLNGRNSALQLLFDLENQGNQRVVKALSVADRFTSYVLYNLIMTFTPDKVILGGYLAQRVKSIVQQLSALSILSTSIEERVDYFARLVVPSQYPDEGEMTGLMIGLRNTVLSQAPRMSRDSSWKPIVNM